MNHLLRELKGGGNSLTHSQRKLLEYILAHEEDSVFLKLAALAHKAKVYRMLSDLREKEGITILLVDQEIRRALKIADYVYVLELGCNKFEGPVKEFTDLRKAFWV